MSGIDGVKHIVLVLSGKGGVGKSSVTTQLAISLLNKGKNVGILDIDLTGPSIPRMLGLEGKQVLQSTAGWVPIQAHKLLKVMSLGFLLNNRGDSVVWRGPKKTAMIRQFLTDVYWGDLDYLIIDTPPGTSDEHIAVMEQLKEFRPDGAVLVTTPQSVATADVRKEISFCRKVNLPVLGVIENMSGYVCPHCSECTYIFSSGGGKNLALENGFVFLGSVPIDPQLVALVEKQDSNLISLYSESPLAVQFAEIADKVLEPIESKT
ncbi:hypothetical protein CANCADRAFT_147340 [Tortispora caseinolytica NRRL Y-17796]|uniref:Uncharacterized protein n=1 Tax=Tortispora caseinolytica NRRL Y-17796 TaxID=767744 RepID=A0A1E4TIV1_9ASCO|nr:hypothetical protein CANCADRAFT_147340 [Tortispora caseinolytica NRRL Y-17796]